MNALMKIRAMLRRDYWTFLKSKWRFVEFFYFPITSLIIWGVFALWTGKLGSYAGKLALVINIFWSLAYNAQSTINLSINEDSWHREGKHILVASVGKWLYLLARIIFGLSIALSNLVITLLISQLFFVDIFSHLAKLLIFVFLTSLISIGMAMIIAGLFFMLGRGYSWLAWSALQLFVMLSFPLAPLSSLPVPFQTLARIMPYGELFEGVRNVVLGRDWTANATAALEVAIVYLLLGAFLYNFGFDRSRKTGCFARTF